MNEFNLVDKKQLLKNNVDWDEHFLLTFRKSPHYVCLNVDTLLEKGYKDWEHLSREIWDYLHG